MGIGGSEQLTLEHYFVFEERIDGADSIALRARWDFGHLLLTTGDDPREIAKSMEKSKTEMYYRRQFAAEYPTEADFSNALECFGSWHELIQSGLGQRTRQPRLAPEPSPLPEGTYDVIYADPPWRYDHIATPDVRAVENQYPTLPLEEIKALEIPAADDAMLFLWATSPKLAESLEVVGAWGFEYRTNMVWVKDRIGMGYYCRSRHELLLIGRRGEPGLPAEATLPESIISAPRTRHSEKPAEVYGVIERMYPGFRYLEMFARQSRAGWAVWGNEVPAEAA